MSSKTLAAALSLLSVASLAMPTAAPAIQPPTLSSSGEFECGPGQLWVIHKDDGVPRFMPYRSLFWNTTGCVEAPHGDTARASSFDIETQVAMNDDYVDAMQWEGANQPLPDHPSQWRDLWESLIDQCQPHNCDGEASEPKSIMQPSPPDTRSIVMKMVGDLPTGPQFGTVKGHFVELLRLAFDRAVQHHGVMGPPGGGSAVRERAPTQMRVAPGSGDYSGYSMQIEIELDEGAQDCGPVAEFVNSVGPLVPHLGNFFAAAGAFCGLL